MCLRCQCILILSPGPKRDAPHRCSLLRGWFRFFQVPICKILTYTNQSWFQFIAKKKNKKCIFRKEQRSDRSRVLGCGDCETLRWTLWGRYALNPDGDIAKAASEFISSQMAVLTETNPNKRGEANESTGRSPIKAEERVVVPSQNTNQERRWGSRDSVRAPVGLSTVSTVAC